MTIVPWLRSPRAAFSRARRTLFERTHPRAPWLAPKAVALLDQMLTPQMVGLEWGSGRSTVWLAQRIGSLTSVEHDPLWAGTVRARLADAGLSVDHRHVPESSDPAQIAARYWEPNPYVMVCEEFADESLDIVLVDGLYRQNCVARVLPKIARAGLLVVDQSHHLSRLEEWKVPGDWEVIYHSDLPYFDTTIWRRP